MFEIRTFNIIVLATSMLLIGCGSSRKNSESGSNSGSKAEAAKTRAFVVEYSRKLGVTVPETANQKLIIAVYEWMGVPYKYGGNDKKGIDCSGLISKVYPVVYNRTVPRITVKLEKETIPVKRNALKEGDLVFFKINTKEVGHAGIYLFGNYFVHASTNRGVIISKLEDGYWNKYFIRGGRFSN